MASVNRVVLIGRVGKDPAIKTFQGGGKIANFSLATSKTWKDRNSGEKKEVTAWHNIAIKNDRLVEVAERFVIKGALLYVEGEIEYRQWEKEGTKHYMTEIVLGPFGSKMDILSGGRSSDAPARQPERTDQRGNPRREDRWEEGSEEVPF